MNTESALCGSTQPPGASLTSVLGQIGASIGLVRPIGRVSASITSTRVIGRTTYFRKSARLVRFVGFYVVEVVRANLRVAFDVVTPTDYAKPGIVAVPLEARSEVEITSRVPERPAGVDPATGIDRVDLRRAMARLDPDDRALLAGHDTPAACMAMSVVVRMADVLGAASLIDIEGAHIGE